MKLAGLLVSTLLFVPLAALAGDAPPKAPVRAVTDTYFGVKVVDPYRWLEDSKNVEVAAWMKAQANHARSVLDRMPMRGELLKRR